MVLSHGYQDPPWSPEWIAAMRNQVVVEQHQVAALPSETYRRGVECFIDIV
jgi:hypothetical protein